MALLLACICGPDPRYSTSFKMPENGIDYYELWGEVPGKIKAQSQEWTGSLLESGLLGFKVGVPKEYFGGGLDPEVEAAIRGP